MYVRRSVAPCPTEEPGRETPSQTVRLRGGASSEREVVVHLVARVHRSRAARAVVERRRRPDEGDARRIEAGQPRLELLLRRRERLAGRRPRRAGHERG